MTTLGETVDGGAPGVGPNQFFGETGPDIFFSFGPPSPRKSI